MARRRTAAVLSLVGPFLALLLVIGAFGAAARWKYGEKARFLTAANARAIAADAAVVAVAGLGMTVVILAGGIDLSAGTALALASVVVAEGLRRGWPWPVALATGMAVGGLCGFANGTMVAKLRLPPFIVTLGTMTIWLGLGKLLSDSTSIRPMDSQVPGWLGDFLSTSAKRAVAGLPLGAWVALAAAVLLAFVLSRTVFGRHVTAIGSNETAARLSGLPVTRLKISIYTLGGLFFGAAGVYLFSRLSIGDSTQGTGKELDVIAAVVIGGGSLAGGRASVAGTLAGAATMTAIRSGCTQLGLENPVQDIALGLIIVAAVAVDQWRQRRAT
jgi:ribose transport system permease protein